MSKATRCIALFFVLVLGATLAPFNRASMQEQPQLFHKSYVQEVDPRQYIPAPIVDDEGYLMREVEGQLSCVESNGEGLEMLKHRSPGLKLRQISHLDDEIRTQATGLTIILRATSQLDANPAAKQAFINAAARWEAVIQTPITVIIDVDFGPNGFGSPWPSGVLGGTLSQGFGLTDNFPDFRSRLISGASSAAETALYNALPTGTVPTDTGPTAGVLAASAVHRAVGDLSPVANPATETTIGAVPSIGFNSGFTYDFDPSDGIDSGKTDFDAVAVHEMGHVLGFGSRVGATGTIFVSILDLFRFRPGTSMGTFPTAQRILSVGGTQVFFAGAGELGLSTGPGSGVGGDNRQASHWKDDTITGQYIGIMDPTIGTGVRRTITSNDLVAFDTFGYSIMGSAPPPTDDSVALTSGVSQVGSIGAPSAGGGRLGTTQYSIQVPSGATQLKIDLSGNQDVDLFARFGSKIVITDGAVVADHRSESLEGVESLTITPGSSPTLRQGTYYIAVGNFGPGAADYTVVANVTTGGGGGGGNSAPVLSTLAAGLTGNTINFTGNVTDVDGDITQAESNLLNDSNQVLGSTGAFSVSFGSQTSVLFSLNTTATGFPTAVKATLVFIDSHGNRSSSLTADFSQADSGGPTIKNVSLSGSKMVIKGKSLSGQLTIEVNGVDVTTLSVSSDKKAKAGGVAGSLHAGPNRIRVRHGTLRSNIFVFTQ